MTFNFMSKLLNKTKFEKNRFQCMYSSIKNDSTSGPKPIPMAYNMYEALKPGERGEGTPILVLHGILGSKTNWHTLGRQMALRTLRRVVTLDLRNHGDSPHTKEFSLSHLVLDLKEVMRELGVSSASLLGHSAGGRAVMAFALRYPQLVKDLVVVDISPVRTASNVGELQRLVRAMLAVRLTPTADSLAKARYQADKQLQQAVRDKAIRNFLLLNLAFDEKERKFYWKVNLKSLLESFDSIFQIEKDKTVFDKNTLFIAGALSDFLKKEDEPEILKIFPKAKFEYITDAGHLLHAERPETFLNTVCSFLGEEKQMSEAKNK